ncbi:MAG: leucyl aminopeptidase family protein [Myxococcota bacterium]|nr:leucyl aminopeptidase family protein [Myxococcota bacterium]
MTLPLLVHVSSDAALRSGAWDALIVVATRPETAPLALRERLLRAAQVDHSLRHSVQLLQYSGAPGDRLIFSPACDLDTDGADIRSISEAAEAGLRRALQAGALAPCLVLGELPANEAFRAGEFALLFGALEALWVPLEAREINRGRSVEALGLFAPTRSKAGARRGLRWVSAVEAGRSLARDLAGADSERMSPTRFAELVTRCFKGGTVRCEVVRERTHLETEYPLLSAVARATYTVKRCSPRVLKLRYEGAGPIQERLFFAGQGVMSSAGSLGAEIRGMAQTSRDRGGAAAIAGFFLSLSLLQPPGLSVEAELGLVCGGDGAEAILPGEIITSQAGQRVRVDGPGAEGALVLADLLSQLRIRAMTEDSSETRPQLFSVAGLMRSACSVFGDCSVVFDNDLARRLNSSAKLAEAGESFGDYVEHVKLRRAAFRLIAPRGLAEDLLSPGGAASPERPLGDQRSVAFLTIASGLRAHEDQSAYPLSYSHLDIGASCLQRAGSHRRCGRPSGTPLLAFAGRWLSPPSRPF